jgi:hypothetical protein
MLGAGIVTEPSKVYDAANALLCGHAPESVCRSSLALGEVRAAGAPAHRVHAVAVANQTAHLIAAVAKAAREAPTNEAAGACDEDLHGNTNLADASQPAGRADATNAPCERLDCPGRTA